MYASVFTNVITPSMRSFPKRKFLIMGFYDALSGLLMLFGGVYASGSYQDEKISFSYVSHPIYFSLCLVHVCTSMLEHQHQRHSSHYLHLHRALHHRPLTSYHHHHLHFNHHITFKSCTDSSILSISNMHTLVILD